MEREVDPTKKVPSLGLFDRHISNLSLQINQTRALLTALETQRTMLETQRRLAIFVPQDPMVPLRDRPAYKIFT